MIQLYPDAKPPLSLKVTRRAGRQQTPVGVCTLGKRVHLTQSTSPATSLRYESQKHSAFHLQPLEGCPGVRVA